MQSVPPAGPRADLLQHLQVVVLLRAPKVVGPPLPGVVPAEVPSGNRAGAAAEIRPVRLQASAFLMRRQQQCLGHGQPEGEQDAVGDAGQVVKEEQEEEEMVALSQLLLRRRIPVEDSFLEALPCDPSLDPTPRVVRNAFSSRVLPTPLRAPYLIASSPAAAQSLGITLSLDPTEQVAAWLSGSDLLLGSRPFAMAYAGHQFGSRVDQLGDGRAVVIAEMEKTDRSSSNEGEKKTTTTATLTNATASSVPTGNLRNGRPPPRFIKVGRASR